LNEQSRWCAGCFNVLWANVLPAWKGTESVALVLLCLAMICFPFSVAATNILLGLLLATGLLSGLWWRGVRQLWFDCRLFFVVLMLYLALVCIGLLWSLDIDWGVKILGRHWFWMLLPIVIMVLVSARNRYTFLVAMSFGLSVGLIYSVLQTKGLVAGHAPIGSTMDNPTGHIGHTSFGFIYGIWAAWLLHLGLTLQGRSRWFLWGLALWALVMVFMAQGKSGYLVSLAVVLVVFAKWLYEAASWRMVAGFASVLLLLLLLILFGPSKARFEGASEVLSGDVQKGLNDSQMNAVSSVSARLEWWKMSYHVWLDKRVLGYGTGSFPKAVAAWKVSHTAVRAYDVPLTHPHNQYLLTMVRWGIVGLLLLLALLYSWIRPGISAPWRHSVAVPLIALTGVALSVQGLSSESLEEHFSTIFAFILLGAGLSEYLSTDT